MKVFAVIDTNVIVSALLSRNGETPVVKVFQALMDKKITLMVNDEIISEYKNVLNRPKFKFPAKLISYILDEIIKNGIHSQRINSEEVFPDAKDIVFYEVALSKPGSFLVTGNLKHFPQTPIVVSPREMMEILKSSMEAKQL